MNLGTIGILGGMYEEVAGLVAQMENVSVQNGGQRAYYLGTLWGRQVVVAFSRWGKTAAATTCTHMVLAFGITELYFVGLCGAVDPGLQIGDMVLGTSFYMHDMDARPVLARFELPQLGLQALPADATRIATAKQALAQMLEMYGSIPGLTPLQVELFNLHKPVLHQGAIASGDRFLAQGADKAALRQALPDVLCVEMEGAAVAQVCYEYKLPYTIVRIVSDTADDGSESDFLGFSTQIAAPYAKAVLQHLLQYGQR